MTRGMCLAIALGSLVAAPGCSCLGGGGLSRTSFMEFRSPCRRQAEPCGAPACAPACEPACEPAPCCGEGGVMSSPGSAPIVSSPATFS